MTAMTNERQSELESLAANADIENGDTRLQMPLAEALDEITRLKEGMRVIIGVLEGHKDFEQDPVEVRTSAGHYEVTDLLNNVLAGREAADNGE